MNATSILQTNDTGSVIDSPSEMYYKVHMIKYNTTNGYTEFMFKVIGPNNISFHINDRYSGLRRF